MLVSIGDHLFLVPSTNLHYCSPNPSSISCLVLSLVGAWNFVTHEILVGVHASIGDHVFLVPSPNLHDCSPNPSSISYLVLTLVGACNLVTHEILVGACKYW